MVRMFDLQVGKYRAVAQRLAGLLQHSLKGCFHAWRDSTDHARGQVRFYTCHTVVLWHHVYLLLMQSLSMPVVS